MMPSNMRVVVATIVVLWLHLSSAQIIPTQASLNNYRCDANTTCKLGCCGTAGYCGFGPTFCGVGNCTSGCDRKSECDPGWGSIWSNATSCPLNVCCSQYGFCGTTQEFCGNATVKSPSCPTTGTTAKTRVVGYYEAWSQLRNCDQIFPRELPQGAWTHLNFAFVYVDPLNYSIVPMDSRDVPLYREFTNLKKNNTGLQTWISVGGWAMNDPGPWNRTFSEIAASAAAQDAFAKSLIKFMDDYGFDGVDIDWEYPVAEERYGRPSDFANFVTWLTSLRAALDGKYGLTITIPSSYWYMRHFDIVNLIQLVDWFNVMTYDLHGIWDAPNPYVGPYVNTHTNLTEIDQSLDLLWRNNIPPEKVALGLGFYGRSFTLQNSSCDYAGCIWVDGGKAGACTGDVGTLSFAEIRDVIKNDNATVRLDAKAAVEEVVWDQTQFVSYDDARTFASKYSYANGKCLGGLLVWAVTQDDRNGTAQQELCQSLGCTVRQQTGVSPGPVCGSSTQCDRYHVVVPGDTCYSIYTAAGLTFNQFQALNPVLQSDCSNLLQRYGYCVVGTPTANNPASCDIQLPVTTSWVQLPCPTTSREL